MIYFAKEVRDHDSQEALERDFFASIKLKNGTYKYTYSNRLDDLNQLVNNLLPSARPLHLMDVAVSSGVSTLEWVHSLVAAAIEHDMTAGDLTVNTYLLSLGAGWHVLVDSTGYPLQFEVNGNAIGNPPGNRMLLSHPVSLFVLRFAVATQFEAIHKRFSRACEVEQISFRGMVCKKVALVSPRFRPSERLMLVEDDILLNASLEGRFHVVRAANVLNLAYFSEETITKMVSTLRRRLLPRGLLVVCRTHADGKNHASIFRMGEDRTFELLAKLNLGSDIDHLVLKLPKSD